MRFATAGDDKYVACHSSPSVIWDLATMIQTDGRMLSDGKMLGSRKGLFFGGITLQEKPDGRILIVDTVQPNVIPRAVGILEGVKRSALAAARGHNAVMIIDSFAAHRAADELGLDLTSAENLAVTSKHFSGPCYVFEIIRNQ